MSSNDSSSRGAGTSSHDPFAANRPAAATDPAEPAGPLDPIAASERVDALDVVRGFALLGIFLMNVEYFSRPMQDMVGEYIDPAMAGLDWFADAAIYVLVQGKFWNLFAIVFGMGFAVMIDRAAAARRPFVPVYLRRSLALMGIGLVHALLIWSGDILVTYAIGALVLLGMRALHLAGEPDKPPSSPKKLAIVGSIAFALPLAALLGLGVLGSAAKALGVDNPGVGQAMADLAAARADAVRVYTQGTWGEAVVRRAGDTAEQLAPTTLLFGLPTVVGLFLIGMAVLRSGVLQRPREHLAMLRRARNWGLPLGFALMGVSLLAGSGMRFDFDLRMSAQMLGYLLAGLVLALAYGASVVLALEGRAGQWLRAWLAPAGRMALTNYLLQSVVGTLFFYGYGFGMWGQVGRAGQLVFVLVVFAVQLLVSRWWLANFRFGPAEWVWRALTYGHAPAFRQARMA